MILNYYNYKYLFYSKSNRVYIKLLIPNLDDLEVLRIEIGNSGTNRANTTEKLIASNKSASVGRNIKNKGTRPKTDKIEENIKANRIEENIKANGNYIKVDGVI